MFNKDVPETSGNEGITWENAESISVEKIHEYLVEDVRKGVRQELDIISREAVEDDRNPGVFSVEGYTLIQLQLLGIDPKDVFTLGSNYRPQVNNPDLSSVTPPDMEKLVQYVYRDKLMGILFLSEMDSSTTAVESLCQTFGAGSKELYEHISSLVEKYRNEDEDLDKALLELYLCTKVLDKTQD